MPDFNFVEKLYISFIGSCFKISTKGGYTHIGHGSDFVETGITVVVIHNKLINFIHTNTIIMIYIFGESISREVGKIFGAGRSEERRVGGVRVYYDGGAMR